MVWQEVVNDDYYPMVPEGLVEFDSGKALVTGRKRSWAVGAEKGNRLVCMWGHKNEVEVRRQDVRSVVCCGDLEKQRLKPRLLLCFHQAVTEWAPEPQDVSRAPFAASDGYIQMKIEI